MNDPEFHKAYEELNERDYIRNARFGSIVSIPLNLSCSVMDKWMYEDRVWDFLKLRIACGILTALVWFWFTHPSPRFPRCHRRIFGVTWFMGPLLMILWMIYILPDNLSPYYAGLNIILLAMGLISPWTYKQNLVITSFVLAMYVVVAFTREVPTEATKFIYNNSTFLFLTAAFVVLGSRSNARQRFDEFSLRWELDKNRRAMEETNRKLMELDQAKSRFFANISHELRTPLTLLIAPLETLIVRFGKTVDEETRATFKTMQANGLRLLKLINDLLDLVRLESGRLEARLGPLQIDEFIKGLASAARQMAENKKLQLNSYVDPQLGTLQADRDKLEKIILNLVFNALKFTPSGGRVDLRAEKQGDEFLIIVADTGVGISQKNLPNVFSRFWQADDSSKRKFQGVGIGLALVKELTEILSGEVRVDSEEGKGTTFTVRLPYIKSDAAQVAAAETANAEPSESPQVSEEWLANLYRRAELFPTMSGGSVTPETAGNGSRKSLLVADDEPDMLRFLVSQLGSRYHVIEATDGKQAVDKAIEFRPDIILLDMMMPEKDGLQACREIREDATTHSIPVVLLTAKADEETKMNALQAGASDFLAKPFSTTELHVRIKNLVESHEYQLKVSKQKDALESTLEQLKETESQLVQSEKLASLGRMSAGIIHEINNPLNYATTGLYTLRNKSKHVAAEQREEYDEILKDIEEGVRRVKNIVSDLRMFSHPDTESREQIELAEVFASALRFLSGEWRDRVHVEQNLPEHQTVWGNKNKLIQMAVNLLQNSLDALKQKQYGDEKPTIWITGRVEAGRSMLSVRDNGIGIKDEHLDKIFDPFFTTKDVGEGMGLGLSICYRIIQECDGRVSVRTEPGKYCEFSLEFPIKG